MKWNHNGFNLDSPFSNESPTIVPVVSQSYLCTLFKQIETYSLVEYIQDAKIHASIPDLMDTKKKLSEIAENYSFCDQFYYSKVFKKYMGVSPTAYRTSIKKENP